MSLRTATPSRIVPFAAIRVLALRGIYLWIFVRLLAMAAFAFAASQGGEPQGMPPIGVIPLCVAVGLVDVRRRQERALWGNLGLSLVTVGGILGVVALIGEFALAIAVP